MERVLFDRLLTDEAATRGLGRELAGLWRVGDVVALWGELGAGKTTLVRGVLEGLGWTGPVRSPTFNLVQLYQTNPPVLHTDLYRVSSGDGLGLEEGRDERLLLIEWPDRLSGLFDPNEAWHVQLSPEGTGRRARVRAPVGWRA